MVNKQLELSKNVLFRLQVEDFLYHEMDLLDKWELMEWADLFDEKEGIYLVPTMNNDDENYLDTLYIIADTAFRVKERAKRLLKKETHIEYPHSKTRHLVTNIKVEEIEDNKYKVNANFIVSRTKREVLDMYVGHYNYILASMDDGFKIVEKRVILDLDSLRPHGKVSIIL